MSLRSNLRRLLVLFPLLDLTTVAARRRALAAAVENVRRGGWGTEFDLDNLPEEQVPWRRQRAMPFFPLTWALSLRATLLLLPLIDLLVFVIARLHLRPIDTAVGALVDRLAPILSLSPLGARLAAASDTSPAAHRIFAYWAVDAAAFSIVCGGLIGVALAEFVRFARVIAAVLVKSGGWADLLYRTVVTGLVVTGLGWALFAWSMFDAYPASFGDEVNRKTLGIALLGALHGFVAFLLPLILVIWCSVVIGLIDAIARLFRRPSGPAQDSQ